MAGNDNQIIKISNSSSISLVKKKNLFFDRKMETFNKQKKNHSTDHRLYERTQRLISLSHRKAAENQLRADQCRLGKVEYATLIGHIGKFGLFIRIGPNSSTVFLSHRPNIYQRQRSQRRLFDGKGCIESS